MKIIPNISAAFKQSRLDNDLLIVSLGKAIRRRKHVQREPLASKTID